MASVREMPNVCVQVDCMDRIMSEIKKVLHVHKKRRDIEDVFVLCLGDIANMG